MLPVREKVRPPMRVLSVGERGDGCRHAAAARHAKQARTRRSIEHDDVVATPAPAAPACRVGQLHGGPAGDRNLLQLAPREEGDELAVGRPERKRAALGSLYRPRLPAGQWPQPDLERGLGTGDEHDVAAIGRDSKLCSAACPSCGGPAKDRLLRRRDRELDRVWRDRGGAGHSQGDDRCGDHRDD